jgi:hypothetical protein
VPPVILSVIDGNLFSRSDGTNGPHNEDGVIRDGFQLWVSVKINEDV